MLVSQSRSGGDVRWITPVVPSTPTLAQVITAGALNNTGINIDMSGNSTITNLTSPTANKDAATKIYVDTRTLANVLAAGNSAGSTSINMNSQKITSLGGPSAADDAATKGYIDTNFKVKQVSAGTAISVTETPAASGTWVIASTATPETLAATLLAGNSAGSTSINMNNNKITSLAGPAAADDAATKGYIDTNFKVKQVSAGTAISVTETPAAGS